MIEKKTLLLIIAPAYLSGCVPMESAPLVYVSKQSVGVNVSAGQPEQPGLAVVLGYGGVDAAYVPVVVSKPCPANRTCEHSNYRPIEIGGTSNESAETKSLVDQMQKLSDEISKVQSDLRVATAEANAADNELKDNADNTKKLTAIDVQISALAVDDPAITALKTQRAQIPNNKRSDAEIIKAGDTARTRISDLTDSLVIKNREKEKIDAQLAGQGKADRKDSYSVYGTFDSNTSGSKDGAKLGLGKVFSTGVAAQNLTSGIGKASAYSEQTRCFVVVKAGEADLAGSELAEYRKSHLSSCVIEYAK